MLLLQQNMLKSISTPSVDGLLPTDRRSTAGYGPARPVPHRRSNIRDHPGRDAAARLPWHATNPCLLPHPSLRQIRTSARTRQQHGPMVIVSECQPQPLSAKASDGQAEAAVWHVRCHRAPHCAEGFAGHRTNLEYTIPAAPFPRLRHTRRPWRRC